MPPQRPPASLFLMAASCDFDVAIVGAGPAGSTAAADLASAGARVAVFERERFPRDKVCGEFLSGEVAESLGPLLTGLGARRIAGGSWNPAHGRPFHLALPRPAWGLSRLALDAALYQRALALGAVFHLGCAVESVSREAGNWRLTTKASICPASDPAGHASTLPPSVSASASVSRAAAPGGHHITARHLLLACGRWWRLRGLPIANAAVPGPHSLSLGVKLRVSDLPAQETVDMFSFRGGYVGVAPVEHGWVNVCGLVAPAAYGKGRNLLAWLVNSVPHPALRERLAQARLATPAVFTAPVSIQAMRPLLFVDGHPVVLAGDAAGFIDPFTGSGISRAILGARLAAQALLSQEEAALHDYNARMIAATGSGFHCASLLRPLLSAPVPLQRCAGHLLRLPGLSASLVRHTRWQDHGGR